MSRAVFVSDIHITSNRDPKYIKFIEFLENVRAKRPEHLFLLGDIFDFWIANHTYFRQCYGQAIELIASIRDQGTKVYYFEGNHDLDLKVFWEETLGVMVFESAHVFQLDHIKVRVEHGDQMDPDDRGYLFLRWLLRTPFVRFLGRHLPQSLVRIIGTRASQTSRKYTTSVTPKSPDIIQEKLRQHTLRSLKHAEFDALICGHTHQAAVLTMNVNGASKKIINLGTWLKEPLVGLFIDGQIEVLGLNDFLTTNSF